MSTRSVSNMFHIVVSTRELQCITELQSYYVSLKEMRDYIITIEKGTNGHLHMDSFIILEKSKRQDKVREHLINSLYNHLPNEEKRNIKCVVNYLDSDPRYAIGYSLKENPDVMKTSFQESYLKESKLYYANNVNKVSKLKDEFKAKSKDKIVTLDMIAMEYLKFCRESGYNSVYYYQQFGGGYIDAKKVHTDLSFKAFNKAYGKLIPFTLYQKINQDKLLEWVDMSMDLED